MKALFPASKRVSDPKINNAIYFCDNSARQAEGERPICRRVTLKKRALVVGQGSDIYVKKMFFTIGIEEDIFDIFTCRSKYLR
jgi:hypothetical protein